MGTDLIVVGTMPFPTVPWVVSRLDNEDEYYVSESLARVALPTMRTDTPVSSPHVWGEDRAEYRIVTGTTAPVSISGHEFDIDLVYTGSANSGMPTMPTHFPLFGSTGQAVSDTLKIGFGKLVASFAIATPVTGPLETHFGGLGSNRLHSYYGGVSNWKISSRIVERFGRTLKQMVHAESVIDGYDHPAERFLQETFKREPDVARQWFWSALRENHSPSLVADSLRLLGRITPADRKWRSQIAAEGLRSRSSEVRDAAMQAIESWGDPALAGVLKHHREQTRWLREYADQIIQDLTG